MTVRSDADTKDREIAATRVYDAPRALVWQAWTDPKHVAQWWGPNGFTNTIHQMDVRPGGVWSFIMHGPDGTDYPNRVEFIEVKEPELLVYIHGDESEPDQFHVTVTMEEEDGKTRLSMRSLFKTKERRDFVVEKYGATEGMNQTLGRLDAHLVTMPGESDFVFERTFDAPRGLVWKAWTEADRMAQWWGPKGSIITVAKLDLKPGGIFHYSMTMPGGKLIWARFEYWEISPPERQVFVNAFSDEKGGIGSNPWLPDWAAEVLNVLTLTEEGGKTRLTLRGRPLNASPSQHKAYADMQPSMRQGFGGTFDQLAAHLAKS